MDRVRLGGVRGCEVIEPRPTSPADAVARARRLLALGGQYVLGTGNYCATVLGGKLVDLPWTERERDHAVGCDCAGLICWAYKLPRHRPGYNRGGGFNVEDDLNSNSFIGDALGAGELFVPVESAPQPGDVLAYPTFRIRKGDGEVLTFIGHVALVVGVDRAVGAWSQQAPQFRLLDIVQVKGPDTRSPAAIATDGSLFDHHNETWPKDEHRARLLRAKP